MEDKQYKGTTTIGIICDEGIVLATERRATMGNLIASRDAQKIYKISDNIAMTIAGSVGDGQRLARILQVEAKLFELRRHGPMTVNALSMLLSNILAETKFAPFYVQILIGGVDRTGSNIYSLDPLGGRIEEKKFVSTGSGSPIAYGVLEDRFKPKMTIEEGVELATRALESAMKRDSASGNGIQIVIITKEKFEMFEKEVSREVLGA
ncbi:proteasome endopeptidase complex, archaeal, beta subunit [Methanocella sp. CWC-04]|uniref:Proteasome subunit beta n=1 Tax=Methanooceanicella nereidis TaxID=2052831 RepID=A0AAP2RAL0_9EURY|nr:archaeal proteasome endopeptidase complex subunit beta [Methanocella sp. CWC-04]MCD1293783.1 proteasome endopeptidase complex, archaeal, beta subunit [Methanocella sp. CWC-04]